MQIRQVTPNDYDAVYTLVETAFQTAQVSDGAEQDFVLELRGRDTFIPELELAAEADGRLVGHIMLTAQPVKGREVKALLLAPLCVDIDYRSKGLGGALIAEAFRLARQQGYAAVFLIGNPDYYGRYGFHPVADFHLENATDVPDKFVQGCELVPGSLSEEGGSVYLA